MKLDGTFNQLKIAKQNFENRLEMFAIDMEKKIDFKFFIDSSTDGILIINQDTESASLAETAIEHIRANGIYTLKNHNENQI